MVLSMITDMRIAARIACAMGIEQAHQKMPVVKLEISDDAIRICAYGGKRRAELIMHNAGKTVLHEGQLFTALGSMLTCYPDGKTTRYLVSPSAFSAQPVCCQPFGIPDQRRARQRVKVMATTILPDLGKLSL